VLARLFRGRGDGDVRGSNRGIDRCRAILDRSCGINDPKTEGAGEDSLGASIAPKDPVGFIIVQVAKGTGTSFKIQAREDYAVTLYTFLQLEQAKKLDSLLEEGGRIEQASLMAIAFHEPKKLKGASEALRRKIMNVPDRATAIRLAAEIWKKANPIAVPKESRGRIRAKSQVPD